MTRTLRALSLLLGLILFAAPNLQAQTADELVTQGRQAWVAEDLETANAKFAAAVALNPSHEAANVWYALTRLLVLPQRAAVKSLLDRLGVAPNGRQVLHWSAGLPKDGDGIPLAPTNVSAQEIINVLHAEVLPELAASATNLSRITRADFQLDLTAAETKGDAVTLDLGDVRLVQAGIHFFGYFGQTLNSWNFDAQLSALRKVAVTGNTTIEEFLKTQPGLLGPSTQAELAVALAEFNRSVASYLAGSDFIRARSWGVTRLFNLDLEGLWDEMGFREQILALQSSLTVPQTWSDDPSLRYNFGRQFVEGAAPRNWLPEFQGNAVVLGTLPTPALGGMIDGWETEKLEREFVNWAYMERGWTIATVPRLHQPEIAPGSDLKVPTATLAGRSYAVLQSSNLITWTEMHQFVATGGETDVNLTVTEGQPGFFRLAELSRPANDNLAQRTLLVGTNLTIHQYVASATYEPNEVQISAGEGSLWWEWTAPAKGWLLLEGRNNYPFLRVYLPGEFPLTLAPNNVPIFLADSYVHVEAGQTYLITASVTFPFFNPGPQLLNFSLHLVPEKPVNDNFADALPLVGNPAQFNGYGIGSTSEPGETAGGSTVWWRWVAPADGRYRIQYKGQPAFFSGTTLSNLVLVAAGLSEPVIQASQGQTYYFQMSGFSFSTGGYSGLVEQVTPSPNEDFASRIRLEGTQIRYSGNQTGGFEGKLWWTWTAPVSGTFELSVPPQLNPWMFDFRFHTGETEQSLVQLFPFTFGRNGPLFKVVAGTTYQISMTGPTGRFMFDLHQVP